MINAALSSLTNSFTYHLFILLSSFDNSAVAISVTTTHVFDCIDSHTHTHTHRHAFVSVPPSLLLSGRSITLS